MDTPPQSPARSTTLATCGDYTDARPGLAIMANVVTPYRVNLHRLIAAQVPELKLHTLITHGVGDFDWRVSAPAEIHLTNFSVDREHPGDSPLRRPLAEWRKAGRLIRYLKANNVRALILCSYRYLSYLRVMNYCHRADVPFWVQLDSNIRNEPKLSWTHALIKRRLFDWWVHRASGVLSMGKLGDQFFLKYGADAARLYRVPCWPDFKAFANVDPLALERFRRKFGLDGRRRYLLFSGRLAPEKRVDLLIDAFVEIASERPDWDLLIVGDGPLRGELRRRVPETLQRRVVWTGFVDGAENAVAFHAAEVLVLPSDREPWALVVQEAMAAALAVVSSDIPGAAQEMVTDKVSGRIFSAGDLQQLIVAIHDVTDPRATDEYRKQSKAAFAHYLNTTDPVAEIRRALADAGALKP